MKLYKLDQDRILEYKIIRSHKETVNYKKEIMSKDTPAFYCIETEGQEVAQKIKNGETVDTGYYSGKNGRFFSISPYYGLNETRQEILDWYMNGRYENKPCVKLENARPSQYYKRDYLLLTQQAKINGNYHRFQNMWKMPIELASFTLLEQGKYERFQEDRNLLDSLPVQLYQALQIGEYDAGLLRTELPEIEQMREKIEMQGKIIKKILTK